ncbi:MAG TPA: NADP oxidoreductase [Thiolapillus brandeum]|uniref:NADP oxidoreductase n=1 Tax=Thiolapillus brandeum TaxID=1076588 RepID=A0A831RW81_9GAMM|nr:NADP oxidoreductase [Thiolapillus brandeum]
MSQRIRIATTSLAGCFGCHMSFLDIDERLIELSEKIEFDRTPLTDIKTLGHCDIGLIEGGMGNTENYELLREFREKCDILVSMGACAINGGIPAMRNSFTLKECLETAYVEGVGVTDPQIPGDPEIPLLLNKIHPLHEVVKIDYFLPGCPPPAEMFWTFLDQLLNGQPIEFTYSQIHYD